ncbi:MAG: 2-C-methyl-D-erythritol 4-phosphate cytidylyltransferase [Candidatus Latescibacteria bacterium]|nr:2-C-methyl-D-erythritol 4-phosphate cytidylyltransferase [Candidatus Latescibacterota bacterium]
MKVTAIIPAAGMGTRMGTDRPKQLIELDGQPILAHTLQAFDDCDSVEDVILVVSKDIFGFCSQHILPRFHKVDKVVFGGEKRQDSVFRGLKAARDDTEIVVIHDGSRPFITPEQITCSIDLCGKTRAVVTAMPVKDTVKSVANGLVERTLDRSGLWLTQTPQTFCFALIWKAYRKAYQEGYYATDDSALVERLGTKVAVLTGSYQNIKITTLEDLAVAQVILEDKKRKEHKASP